MTWSRIRDRDKLAFREDLQADPTLTDLQKRLIGVVAQNWSGATMHSECSLTFMAAGAGTSKHTANKYKAALIESGRVSIKRDATYTASTLWEVNWWFRGSAWTRLNNDGKPILDIRRSPNVAHTESPVDAHTPSPNVAQGSPPELRKGVPRSGDQLLSKEERDNSPPSTGAGPVRAAPGGAEEEEEEAEARADNPHKLPAGFAKWKIVHAEYGDDDVFVAHLRSGQNREFMLRLPVDSDDFSSLDNALDIDGEAAAVVGEMVAMSINRTGPKHFMRAGPMPWQACTIMSGESFNDGAARVRIRLDGPGDRKSTMSLNAGDATRLTEACGGEDEAIGARVRYRLLPDDTIEFRPIAGT
jgi:hypothetical protein